MRRERDGKQKATTSEGSVDSDRLTLYQALIKRFDDRDVITMIDLSALQK